MSPAVCPECYLDVPEGRFRHEHCRPAPPTIACPYCSQRVEAREFVQHRRACREAL